MEIYSLPLLLYLGMLGLRWLYMHLWLNLINQTIDIQEKYENLCTTSMESCSQDCVMRDYGRVPYGEVDIQKFA